MNNKHQNTGNAALPDCKPYDRNEILEECEALAIYIARHGDILKDDKEKECFKRLTSLVSKCQGNDFTVEDWSNLIEEYANVSNFTYSNRGVNGRTVLDTWGRTEQKSQKLWKIFRWIPPLFYPKRYQRPLTVAFWLLIIAIFLQISIGWASRISDPSLLGKNFLIYFNLVHDLIPLLLPAVWGSIGSCVFLMKRISDKLFEYAYEEARLKGDGTRILLGAIFGILVVQVSFPNHEENLVLGEIGLGPMTAAFVAGLGVKVVYAAFEAVVEGLSKRISGQNSPNT